MQVMELSKMQKLTMATWMKQMANGHICQSLVLSKSFVPKRICQMFFLAGNFRFPLNFSFSSNLQQWGELLLDFTFRDSEVY